MKLTEEQREGIRKHKEERNRLVELVRVKFARIEEEKKKLRETKVRTKK